MPYLCCNTLVCFSGGRVFAAAPDGGSASFDADVNASEGPGGSTTASGGDGAAAAGGGTAGGTITARTFFPGRNTITRAAGAP